MIKFILPFRTKIGAMLVKKGLDNEATAFSRECLDLEKKVNKHTTDRCFMSFLAGVVISMAIFGGLFYYMYNENSHGLTLIENAIRSK